jgi:hypothetical protein
MLWESVSLIEFILNTFEYDYYHFDILNLLKPPSLCSNQKINRGYYNHLLICCPWVKASGFYRNKWMNWFFWKFNHHMNDNIIYKTKFQKQGETYRIIYDSLVFLQTSKHNEKASTKCHIFGLCYSRCLSSGYNYIFEQIRWVLRQR